MKMNLYIEIYIYKKYIYVCVIEECINFIAGQDPFAPR